MKKWGICFFIVVLVVFVIVGIGVVMGWVISLSVMFGSIDVLQVLVLIFSDQVLGSEGGGLGGGLFFILVVGVFMDFMVGLVIFILGIFGIVVVGVVFVFGGEFSGFV